MRQLCTLFVIHLTESTSTVRTLGVGVVGVLDSLGLPRQWDHKAGRWLTSRRTVNYLVDYAEARAWRVHVLDDRQLTLAEAS